MTKFINFLKSFWLLLVLGATLGALIIFTLQAPSLVKIEPLDGSQGVDLNREITLTFNKAVNPSNLKIKSTPEENFLVKKDPSASNSYLLTHDQSFNQNTNYELTISYNDKTLTILKFKTAKAESNSRDLQKIVDEMVRDYPLSESLPISTNNYQVVYIAPLTLQVELYESGLSQSLITKEIEAWFKNKGADINTHKLVFKEPSHPAPTTQR